MLLGCKVRNRSSSVIVTGISVFCHLAFPYTENYGMVVLPVLPPTPHLPSLTYTTTPNTSNYSTDHQPYCIDIYDGIQSTTSRSGKPERKQKFRRQQSQRIRDEYRGEHFSWNGPDASTSGDASKPWVQQHGRGIYHAWRDGWHEYSNC